MSDDHRVGYRQPPTDTRFKPGISGNPTGRPKRCPSFRDTLLARLAAPASGGGSPHGSTNLDALVTTLVKAAISGDPRAQALVLGALTRFGDAGDQGVAADSPDDEEIIDAYAVPEKRAAIDSTPVASEPGGDQTAGGEAGTVAPANNGLRK
jgi:Family of unknown function (DUF5681)